MRVAPGMRRVTRLAVASVLGAGILAVTAGQASASSVQFLTLGPDLTLQTVSMPSGNLLDRLIPTQPCRESQLGQGNPNCVVGGGGG
jgi:hypothetical protein